MKEGKLNLGKYTITSQTTYDVLDDEDFNIVNIEENIIYISKNPISINENKFWVTIYFERNVVKKIELCNADEKFKMNYRTMKSDLVEELRKAHDSFLEKNLGMPDKKNISSVEYIYAWGKIISYYDNKASECGIVICYI